MIESMFSLPVVLLLFLSSLFLSEFGLQSHTLECSNFFASRADVVGEKPQTINLWFDELFGPRLIFFRWKQFGAINPIQLEVKQTQLVSKLKAHLLGQPLFISTEIERIGP